MPFTDRELLARVIKCEAGGEGENGMKAVATVIMNRVHSSEGEYSRVSDGGSIRNIIFQTGQFTCAVTYKNGKYNPQNIYNLAPDQMHYEIADWAMSGNKLNEVDMSLWFMNPFNINCPQMFPYNGTGNLHTRVNEHCFYTPTDKYYEW